MNHELTWYQVDRGASVIAVKAGQIYGDPPPIDVVVGINPTGLVPALVLSELWGKPLVVVQPDSFPTIYGERLSGTGVAAPVPRLFIISGESSVVMNRVIQNYRDQNHEWICAALFHNPHGDGLLPNIFWRIMEDNDTIKYPWQN